MKQIITMLNDLSTQTNATPTTQETLKINRASALVEHHSSSGELLHSETVYNLITNVGRVQYHAQIFGTSGLLTNGLNFIGLSNDVVSETAASTVLSNEIAANGLARAQGTVTLPTGAGTQTTIVKVFTATGAQSAQKCALFSASSAGVMNHVLGFTQRSLQISDTLTITVTITLS